MRFAALDGWRGVCALLVCLYHFDAVAMWWLRSEPFFLHSFLFVDFFFVLSGFVISHSYAAKIGDWPALGRFMLRRFGRLWPLHMAILGGWLALELGALAARPYVGHFSVNDPLTGPNSLPALAANILLLHAFGLFGDLTWNGPSWSIAAEFWTYLVFALFCLMPGRRNPGLALLLGAMGAGVVALFSPRYMDATYDYGFFRCVYGFFLGHLVYRFRSRRGLGQSARGLGRTPLELGVLLLVTVFVCLAARNSLSLMAPVVFALVVYVFSFDGGACAALLAQPPFVQFGRWSYSIYMVHAIVVQAMIYAVRMAERSFGTLLRTPALGEHGMTSAIWLGSNYAMALLALAYVGTVIVAASITYRLVEEPSRHYFNALAKRDWSQAASAWRASDLGSLALRWIPSRRQSRK